MSLKKAPDNLLEVLNTSPGAIRFRVEPWGRPGIFLEFSGSSPDAPAIRVKFVTSRDKKVVQRIYLKFTYNLRPASIESFTKALVTKKNFVLGFTFLYNRLRVASVSRLQTEGLWMRICGS
jgi:hypothetical protein